MGGITEQEYLDSIARSASFAEERAQAEWDLIVSSCPLADARGFSLGEILGVANP
ncbi:MAG: hypothetical protein NT080_00145 [Spirochaetes bacterium]|nr:hypothetical protein [Spirochaetota bacterium]